MFNLGIRGVGDDGGGGMLRCGEARHSLIYFGCQPLLDTLSEI